MTSKPVALLLSDLAVTKSHSRPHVSNDNCAGTARARGRRQHFRYARYGTRDMDRCASNG